MDIARYDMEYNMEYNMVQHQLVSLQVQVRHSHRWVGSPLGQLRTHHIQSKPRGSWTRCDARGAAPSSWPAPGAAQRPWAGDLMGKLGEKKHPQHSQHSQHEMYVFSPRATLREEVFDSSDQGLHMNVLLEQRSWTCTRCGKRLLP